MPTNICIFEDEHFSSLYPLSLTRPVFDLHCGMMSLQEKINTELPRCSALFILPGLSCRTVARSKSRRKSECGT